MYLSLQTYNTLPVPFSLAQSQYTRIVYYQDIKLLRLYKREKKLNASVIQKDDKKILASINLSFLHIDKRGFLICRYFLMLKKILQSIYLWDVSRGFLFLIHHMPQCILSFAEKSILYNFHIYTQAGKIQLFCSRREEKLNVRNLYQFSSLCLKALG